MLPLQKVGSSASSETQGQSDGSGETIGPFVRGKIRRVLHKTRTSRINGTVRVLFKTRLIFPPINGLNA